MNQRIANEIRDYYWRNGCLIKEIAEAFGVKIYIVQDILNNKSFKDETYVRPNKILEVDEHYTGIPQEVFDHVEKLRQNNYKMIEW